MDQIEIATTTKRLEIPTDLYETALGALREVGLDVSTILRNGQDRLRVISIPAFLRKQAE